MKVLLVVALLVAVSAAQFSWLSSLFSQKNYVLDYLHAYRFELHENKHPKQIVLIAISDASRDRACHIINVDSDFDKYLYDHENIEKVSEEIYHQIKNHEQMETPTNLTYVYKTYKDYRLNSECHGHKMYIMTYKPSFMLPSDMPMQNTTSEY